MTRQPHTAEGDLLRERRDMLGWTVERAIKETPLKRSKWGDVERGRTRARKDHPSVPWHAPAPTVAIMARRLGVDPEELRQAGREDAAGILERETARPAPPAPPPAPDAIDRLFAAFVRDRYDRHDQETLEYLWRGLRGGQPKPLDERVQAVIDWIDDRPRREAEIRAVS